MYITNCKTYSSTQTCYFQTVDFKLERKVRFLLGTDLLGSVLWMDGQVGRSGRGWMNSIHDYRISTCSNRCVGRVMCCGWMGRDDDGLTRAKWVQ